LDIYDDVAVSEQLNSQLGLFNLKGGAPQILALPQNPLGRLYAADLTPDFNWLAVSGYSRGSVWNVAQNKGVLYLRGFRGAYLGEDKNLYADFPKLDATERTVARLNLTTGDGVAGPKLESSSASQYGAFVVDIKPAKKGGGYWENVLMEVLDAKTMTSLWSTPFPKERPRYFVSPRDGTMTLVWPATSKAASADIKGNAELTRQLNTLKEKQGDYLLKVVDLETGVALGAFLMETGKGSFRINNVIANGDRVAVSDNENRTLVYSLRSGEQLGKVFGREAAFSNVSNLLCVENKDGILELYDLTSFAKRQRYTFGSRVSLVSFSPDGKRMFVLTANQIVYLLDVSSLSGPQPGA
jgi:WD40 repeat protein